MYESFEHHSKIQTIYNFLEKCLFESYMYMYTGEVFLTPFMISWILTQWAVTVTQSTKISDARR